MKAINRKLQSTTLAFVIAAGVATTAQPTHAQAIVNDPVHQLQNILTQLYGTGKDTAEYSTQAQRWYQTYEHYQQQLVKMRGIVKSFALPTGQTLKEVPPNYMVAERCGAGLSLTGALAAISPRSDSDYIGQQRDICSAIQRVQNIKYNETVAFLRDTVPKMEQDVKRVEAERAKDDNSGTVSGATEESAALLTNLTTQMQSWGARMQAYDSFAAGMQESQRQLARMALGGEKSPIGSLVKTGVLKAALKVGK